MAITPKMHDRIIYTAGATKIPAVVTAICTYARCATKYLVEYADMTGRAAAAWVEEGEIVPDDCA